VSAPPSEEPVTTDEDLSADQTSLPDQPTDGAATLSGDATPGHGRRWRPASWKRMLAYGLLPALAFMLTAAAGVLKWQDSTARDSVAAGDGALQAARDGATALLSYRPDTVDQQLHAARGRLTGSFRDSYASLTDDVVIPGAKQKQISAVATVPAASIISATPDRSQALVFVNQTTIAGQGAPTDSTSSVRITLEKVAGRWLISGFDPV
jgi:Mce-associated membrane protein